MEGSVGSGSGSSPRREDEGDSKPPSFRGNRPDNTKSALRLNTPQADEGPGQAGTPSSAVASLPHRRENKGAEDNAPAAPSPPTVPAPPTAPVIGWSEDGPVRASASAAPPAPAARYTPPPTTVSPESNRYRGASEPHPSTARARPPSSAAQRASANNNGVAAGVPVAASRDVETNETPAPTEDGPSSSPAVPKKYLYLGSAVLVALVVAVVVVAVVLSNNNKDSGPAPASSAGAPTASPPADGPAAVDSIVTLASVAERGSLNCGISLLAGFGSVSNGEYAGLDVDLVSTR